MCPSYFGSRTILVYDDLRLVFDADALTDAP